MIDRIGHINIRTTFAHYEDTLKFYEKLMGLKRAQSMATPVRTSFGSSPTAVAPLSTSMLWKRVEMSSPRVLVRVVSTTWHLTAETMTSPFRVWKRWD